MQEVLGSGHRIQLRPPQCWACLGRAEGTPGSERPGRGAEESVYLSGLCHGSPGSPHAPQRAHQQVRVGTRSCRALFGGSSDTCLVLVPMGNYRAALKCCPMRSFSTKRNPCKMYIWWHDRQSSISYRHKPLPAERPSSERANVDSDEAARAIKESCLVPFLEAELSQASFTDMGNR